MTCLLTISVRSFASQYRQLQGARGRVLAPGIDVVLEFVRMAVNDQFSALTPTMYAGSKATNPRPYASLDAMWSAF